MIDLQTTQLALAGFKGVPLYPGDTRYDEARRVFNGMIDRYPALMARCRDAADVAAAVGLAREQGLPLSVYGGSWGHGRRGLRWWPLHRPAGDEGHNRRH